MLDILNRWYRQKFSDPQAAAILVIFLLGIVIFYFFGKVLIPLVVAIVIAYLLDWPVESLSRFKIGRKAASSLVLFLFLFVVVVALLFLLPTIVRQGTNLLYEYPAMLHSGQAWLESLPARYPEIVDAKLVETIVSSVQERLMVLGNDVLRWSFTSIGSLANIVVYAILVPLMVFFMLADKKSLQSQITRFLPSNRSLLTAISKEMNGQIVNYIRGKATEILIVGGASYLVFAFMDLRYSLLLAVLVGLSVVIPFVGAFAVTIPVAMVGLFQWGFTAQFGYLILAYMIIQILDGNVLVPILFSEAVNLHPLAIVMAVMVFGGLWGVWGVFFAIPLATLVKAVINAWPHNENSDENSSAG
ncbi:AI-2E family transporter [Alginatibacterium sediminis]|uniref:AI-2E family transporter n=1 Tax=Alginatibacterium sediminis TaxID=2164068 RepID=A0A420EBK1_9ALTE|nr:AI-2E family transporter [Alginatibacterium sediminis]RKF18056.1 AI-2E family transporter [Alginatibacterium sediminis]